MASNGGALPGRLAAWTRRRPEPRLWITVAGTGCVLAVLGVIFISGDARAPSDGDEGSNLPGILLCLAVVAAGFVLMHFFRELPASTAGVTAVVLGLPALLVFLTFDEESVPPVSFEAILGGSALVWLIAYLVGPGAGRPILLGAALLFGWLFVLQVVEDPLQNGVEPPAIVEEDPFGVDTGDGTSGDPFADEFDEEFGGDAFGVERGGASPTSIGIISVIFGAGYLLGARLLDRGGQPGAGVPFAFVGLVALPVGIAFLGDDLEALGAGIAFIVVGALVIWSGALGGRRATTVIGAAEIFVGIVLILADVMEDSSATSVGTAMFVIGALIIVVAQLLHSQTGETPQLTPGPSRFDVSSGPRKAVRPSFAPMGGPPPGQPWQPGASPSGPYPPPGPPTPQPGPPAAGAAPQQPPAGPPPPPPPPPPGGGSF